MNFEEAKSKLAKYGQLHVLDYYDELSDEEKKELLQQIDETDFSVIRYAANPHGGQKRGKITPLGAMEIPEIEKNREHFEKTGLEALRAQKIGACMYNIGITKPVYIMQRLIENLMDVVNQSGVPVPLFIMTSDKNHDKTVKFMEDMDYFGYDRDMVRFFKQDMAPAVDYDGKVYMESRSRIATSPNGNGGWFLSMMNTGVLDRAKELGVEWLNIFAVDNVLQRIADPCFVGATLESGCATGAKVVRKVTPELLEAKDEKGEPAYNFGVILNYLFREKDLERIVNEELPVHVVEKKIPYMNREGEEVKPEEPNGYKFEQLAVDLVRELDTCLPYEVLREKEFAPIKNKTGIDSVESARQLCLQDGIEL